MSSTTNLRLPYLDANQNQKTVTHNAALTALDALVNCQVQDTALTAPPAAPADGQCWIVGSGGTGAWAGRDLQIAAWQDGAWSFYPPNRGTLAYSDASSTLLVWTGSVWVSALGAITQLQLASLGLGTAPDSNNPLSVKGGSALFSAGSAGDFRLTLNKAATSNTASLLFQDNFSGRAEIGLAGDDGVHVKVSPDGSTFYDAIQVSGTGTVSFLNGPTAPTPPAGSNNTRLATTAYVQGQGYLTAAPVTSVAGRTGAVMLAVADVGGAAPLASPALTGTPTAPTPAAGTGTTQLATAAFVLGQAATAAPLADGAAAVGSSLLFARQDHVHPTDATRAPLASPALTGIPTAPTAGPGANSVQLATTAYADRAAGASNLARTQVSDAAYAVVPTDRVVAVVSLIAARTLTLPAASAYPQGATLTIVDESGACSASTAITVARAGSDLISGVTSAVLATAYGYVALESNGSNKWTVIDAPAPVTTVAGRVGAVALAVGDVSGAAPLASPALTGVPTAPNAAAGTNSSQLATTSFVAASFVTYAYAGSTYATAANATLTGTPTAPTPAAGDTSTKLATTAYADRAVAAVSARTQVGDAAYIVLSTDRLVAVISLTAARALALPAASAFPQGATLTVVDESGACSATRTITLTCAGSDTLNGAPSAVLARAYGVVALESNGSNKWTVTEPVGTLAAAGSGSTNNSASGSGAYVSHTPTVTLPAGFLQQNRPVRVSAAFRVTTGSSPPNLQIALLAGSTPLVTFTPITTTASQTSISFGLTFLLTATAAPSTSSAVEAAPFGNTNATGLSGNVANQTSTPVNLATNAALTLALASQWSAAGTGTTAITLTQLVVEALT